MFSLLFLFLLNLILFVQCQNKTICSGNTTYHDVENYCSGQNGTMTQRCCFDEGNSIIAIDLVNGGYIQIPDFTQIKNLLSAKFIDLRSNPLESVPHSSDFVGLQLLERLYLPLQYLCPGGVDVWQKIESLPTENHCIQQKDFCANSTLKCTEKSSCSPNGPGQYLCLCEFGYTGYKCLRYGHFPTALFLGLTLPLTAVLSVVLYYTQRRHVKTN